MLLYLHIPFCASKCGYCAFHSSTASKSLHAPYFNAIKQQLNAYTRTFKQPLFESVFIGGGTPSIIEAKLYEPIFETFMPYLMPDAEISIEANPNHLNEYFARTLKELGVKRISLGVQSFDEKKLAWLERDHSPHNVFASLDMLHAMGWENINIDLIYNTPFDNMNHLTFEVNQVKNLPITHLCAYSLMIEEGSRFFKQGKEECHGEEFKDLIEDIGFKQYEVSNYAKKAAYHCKHNIGYWQHKPYMGIGAGAVSFMDNKRYTNIKDIASYINNPLSRECECLTQADLSLERLFLGFRSHAVGVKKQDIPNQKNLQIALKEKLIYEQDNRLYAYDLFLADEIALFLYI